MSGRVPVASRDWTRCVYTVYRSGMPHAAATDTSNTNDGGALGGISVGKIMRRATPAAVALAVRLRGGTAVRPPRATGRSGAEIPRPAPAARPPPRLSGTGTAAELARRGRRRSERSRRARPWRRGRSVPVVARTRRPVLPASCFLLPLCPRTIRCARASGSHRVRLQERIYLIDLG